MTIMSEWGRLVLEETNKREQAARNWVVPDDPFADAMRAMYRAMYAWPNPLLPLDSPRVRQWGPAWEPIHDSHPPTVHAKFTAEDWAAWWTQRAESVVQWPLSMSGRRCQVALSNWVHAGMWAEQRAKLAEQARGRIMGNVTLPDGSLVEFGGSNHGMQHRVWGPHNHSSSEVRRRDGTPVRQRGRSKGRRSGEGHDG